MSVAVKGTESAITISVADRGPGIPADERENVLQRFDPARAQSAQPRQRSGSKLVAAVMRLHGAVIRMADNMPGLKIEL